jgi:hypothetical protein
LKEGFFACPQESALGSPEDREWVAEHCPQLENTHATPKEVRNAFWQVWTEAKSQGATLWADCSWPVEANFLSACVADDPQGRKWHGPYPMHEIATVFQMVGINPLDNYERLPGEEEHHPLGDARQSARLLTMALNMPKV